jgi:DNA-binding CsgD family transcriptional regulator
MTAESLDELIRSLDGLPVAAILTELRTRTFIAVNDGAAALFGSPAGDLIGSDVLARIQPGDREAVRKAYDAMAGKVIDGYQVRRGIVTPDGHELAVGVWGRRVEGFSTLYGLWILVPGPEPATAVDIMMAASPVVLAVTDHDWQIEYMSADADLLGVRGSELRGFPLLGLVHPSAAGEFLAAATRTVTDHVSVTVWTRMRVGSDQWADRSCLIVRMCEHQPPRLGVVISAGMSEAAGGRSESQLDGQVRHCALEARASQTLDALPALTRLPPGSELSARQTEIVARLVAGERVPDIARSMFLSPSTVRNHLAAIYRKFAVHSQAELLAALLRASAPHDQ